MKIDVKKHKRKLKGKTVPVRKHKRSLDIVKRDYYGENTYYVKPNKNRTIVSFSDLEKEEKRKNPYGDADRDGVKNKKDCHPLDPTRKDEGIRTYINIYGDWVAEVDGERVGAHKDFETEEEALAYAKDAKRLWKYTEEIQKNNFVITNKKDGLWEAEINGAVDVPNAYETKEEAEMAAEIYIQENKDQLDKWISNGAAIDWENMTEAEKKASLKLYGIEDDE